MSPEVQHRRTWPIDAVLEKLRGENVRVAAQAFAPDYGRKYPQKHVFTARDLILPDGSAAAGLPLFFEGRLQEFVREIGVVWVHLDSLATAESSAQGILGFRGQTAVMLRGPAVVRLAHPFHVEKLPADEINYWEDLRCARVQFKLPL